LIMPRQPYKRRFKNLKRSTHLGFLYIKLN
jgi:hypothetical protein